MDDLGVLSKDLSCAECSRRHSSFWCMSCNVGLYRDCARYGICSAMPFQHHTLLPTESLASLLEGNSGARYFRAGRTSLRVQCEAGTVSEQVASLSEGSLQQRIDELTELSYGRGVKAEGGDGAPESSEH